MLNGQSSPWSSLMQELPENLFQVHYVFLIYCNDLSGGLSSNAKLFADDTSLFSAAHNIKAFAIELNSDLTKINDWAFHWKMAFNPDHSQQAQEFIFSRKLKKAAQPLFFKNNNISQVSSEEHLGCILDVKLTFDEHLKNVFNRTKQTKRNDFCRRSLIHYQEKL